MSNFLKLIISIVICQLAGVIGTFFTMDSIPTWYAALNKPDFNPPNWIFGPVWIFLYLLMGISLFLVWRENLKNDHVKSAFMIFMIQLVLNTLWSIVFFGMQSITGGLIIILLLWIFIILTIIKFRKVSAVASMLLIPYLLWVTFAAVLNFYIFKLN
ncbi:MAG: TspO/MBR family protein [bacterium]